MYYCPACSYQGYVDTEQCVVCLGHGVLVDLPSQCKNCSGKGCWQCRNTGVVARPIPFAMSTKRIPCDDLREMFTALRTGYSAEDDLHRPDALGVVAVLLEMSDERSDRSMEHGEWINSVLEGSDALLIEASGLWLERNGKAIRIYTYNS